MLFFILTIFVFKYNKDFQIDILAVKKKKKKKRLITFNYIHQ